MTVTRLRPGAEAQLNTVLEAAARALAMGDAEAAGQAARRALRQDASHPSALRLLAMAERAAGRATEAVDAARRAVAAAPGDAEGQVTLGLALEAAGDAGAAATAYDAALALAPDHPVARNNAGSLRLAAGDLLGAETHVRAAIAARPDFARAHGNLGAILLKAEQYAAARESLARALALDPAQHDTRRLLGLCLVRLGEPEAALAQFRRALAARPDDAHAHWNLGECLLALRRPAEALDSLRATWRLGPSTAVAHAIGTALLDLDRLDEAEAWLQQALPGPQVAITRIALGNVALRRHRLAEAVTEYEAAGRVQPGLPDAAFHAALVRLGQPEDAAGWRQGWREYEARWHCKIAPKARGFAQPLWLGDAPLAGRTILLHAEQGFGDTLQFLRFLPAVAATGARVVLEVQQALLPLLAGLPGVAHLVAHGEALPPFDAHCPLLSLPLALGLAPDAIPPPLALPVAERATPPAGARRVGLAWAGNPVHPDDRRRSMPLAALAPLLEVPGLEFTVLQPERRAGEAELLSRFPHVRPSGAAPGDFAATARVVAGLDLVVTVDSAVAHLAGTLGRPVWVLLAHTADWRWGFAGARSAWYPSARLFRQPAPGDWASAVGAVVAALAG